ncbi:FecR family protein [Pedobacter sp.]|jgi:transmembrane sensor|uniref:FecR family protein n=1 Tax=Pedobacter sp. TaxID=1411316 RepID=UPI002CC07DE2|nr:FecR family protein [Pedobacter sp.]HWW43421.1 FecR family protein [Pedobacter sp.]
MKERIKYLLEQFEKGRLNTSETRELWFLVNEEEEGVAEGIEAMLSVQEHLHAVPEVDVIAYDEMLDAILSADRPFKPKKIFLMPSHYWAAAAMLFAVLSLGLYFYLSPAGQHNKHSSKYAVEIRPGGNKAILKLADGSEISLTDSGKGTLADRSGIRVTKTTDGSVMYQVIPGNEQPEKQAGYNTISTPRGGQYQIELPDGTRVWLNSASSLKFPQSFAQMKTRAVELKGEAYFEVFKNKKQPFQVRTGVAESGRTQLIEVLGTHFNVNAYADEASTKTTLLEGLVRVNSGTELRPGEQAVLNQGHVRVVQVDTEEAVAWKNGYFIFTNEDIYSIMRKISRWYDVEVVYEGKITDNTFNGPVSRSSKVSEVLDILELTKTVHFKIEGRRITVMP